MQVREAAVGNAVDVMHPHVTLQDQWQERRLGEPDFVVDDVQLFLQHHRQCLGVGVQVTTPTSGWQQIGSVLIQNCATIYVVFTLHMTSAVNVQTVKNSVVNFTLI